MELPGVRKQFDKRMGVRLAKLKDSKIWNRTAYPDMGTLGLLSTIRGVSAGDILKGMLTKPIRAYTNHILVFIDSQQFCSKNAYEYFFGGFARWGKTPSIVCEIIEYLYCKISKDADYINKNIDDIIDETYDVFQKYIDDRDCIYGEKNCFDNCNLWRNITKENFVLLVEDFVKYGFVMLKDTFDIVDVVIKFIHNIIVPLWIKMYESSKSFKFIEDLLDILSRLISESLNNLIETLLLQRLSGFGGSLGAMGATETTFLSTETAFLSALVISLTLSDSRRLLQSGGHSGKNC